MQLLIGQNPGEQGGILFPYNRHFFIHPREVFAPAIEDRAASIIIGHNHPSGMLDISEQDREVTKRIKQAGDLLGIQLDDHIIVAGDSFVSAY